MPEAKARPASKPDYVLALEASYGPPSQDGFGAAVFFAADPESFDLEALAKEYYQYFVGELWERWGAETWLSPWREAYRRPKNGKHRIEDELRSIEDADAHLQVGLILDVSGDAAKAREALSAAYDAPDVVDVRAYLIGDGDAVSGLLLAGQRRSCGVTLLIALMD